MKQAEVLARKEPKKPLQASLRRSVSTLYYAIFHLLVDETTKMMLTGHKRSELRSCLARAFRHSDMRTTAKKFASGSVPDKLSSSPRQNPVQQELKELAEAFAQL